MFTRISQAQRARASTLRKISVDKQVRNRYVPNEFRGFNETASRSSCDAEPALNQFPVAAGVAVPAVAVGRISTAVRGNVNVPPASSITLIWQM